MRISDCGLRIGVQIRNSKFAIRNVRGFTLVELVVVALVLGLLIVGVAPRLRQTAERLRAEQAAFEIAQSLRYAHAQAVTQARTVRWSWDAGTHHAQLQLEADGGTAEPLAPGVTLPEGIGVSLTQDETPLDSLHFTPHGTTDPATILIEFATHRYRIQVDGITSRVDVAPAPGI